MAEKASITRKQGGNGWLRVIFILLFLLFIPVFGLAVGYSTGASTNSGPSPDGSDNSTPINTAPDSPIQKTLGDLERYANPDQYLVEDGKFLDEYAVKLQELQAKLAPVNGDENTATDPAFTGLPAENIKEMREIVTTMLSEYIPTIRAKVAANAAPEARSTVTKLIESRGRLNELWYPKTVSSIIDLARTLATENVASGYTKYPYSQKTRANLTRNTTPATSDCSSFISHLLIQAGVPISTSTPFTTADLYLKAKKREFGLQLVVEATTEAGITQQDITNNPDYLKPGDIVLSGSESFAGGNKPEGAHAAVYTGSTPEFPQDMVESSKREDVAGPGIKDGIQFYTLEKRFRNSNKIQAIIRYGGGK